MQLFNLLQPFFHDEKIKKEVLMKDVLIHEYFLILLLMIFLYAMDYYIIKMEHYKLK